MSFILNKSTIFLLTKPRPLGYLLARIICDELEIIDFLTIKNQRRKGLGKVLLKELYLLACEKKISRITLEVSKQNFPAIKLYESFKFKKVGIRKNYYVIKKKKIDAIIMQLVII